MIMPLALLLILALQAAHEAQWHEPHVLAAKDYLARKDFARAAETLGPLLEAEPGLSVDLHLMLLESHARLGQWQQAITAADRAVQAHPGSGPLMKHAGELLYRSSSTSPRAGELLEKASRLLPRDPQVHHLYAQWALLNHREQDAVGAEQTALALTPPRNEAALMQIYTVIGIGQDKLGRPKQAEDAFRRALAVNRRLPSPDPNAANEYVQFLVRQSREDEAQRIVDQILQFAPAFGPARLERARRLNELGKTEEALAEGLKALELAGDDTPQARAAHAFLARTYFAAGRQQEARKHQQWIETHP